MPETPAEIEARIARRREALAASLEEIGVRVHPRTLVADVKARAASTVDRTTGRALTAVNQAVGQARSQVVTSEGAPRLERLIPVVAVVAVVAGVLVLSSRRRRR